MKILCISGWSFGTGFWAPLAAHCPPTWSLSFCAPSAQGASACALKALFLAEHWDGVIAHSWGGLLALKLCHRYSVRSCSTRKNVPLLLCHGFRSFVTRDGFPVGHDPRVLRAMTQGLRRNPARVVADFHRRAGFDPVVYGGEGLVVDPLCPDALAWGLESLRCDDLRGCAQAVPVQVLACRDDPIVPPELTAACFEADQVSWSEQGGHFLPLSRPQQVAIAMQALLCAGGTR